MVNELDIFSAALELASAEERRNYLDEACAENIDLRDRIEELLKSAERATGFLESPSPELAATISRPVAEASGTQIGPYKLLQQVGEGGMGVVYMAEQTEPVKRRVALKIIKPGMDSRQVIARFEAERQALALMDHPHIAKVLDAGMTESGRPFFVMELVKGVSLTKYCDEQHLTLRERLRLFVPICQAVQHAHQKGVIHRDLKPSNVLVALYDGQAIPKVIDFGVAKAISQQLTEKTMFTEYGQIVGTLEYMSPEQAQVNQLDIDTRSDIYSLGVLLYELLTGVTPIEKERLRSAAFDEMLRIIQEEEPPRPSTRLSTIETLPSVAANRRIDPNRLRTTVRGELDWIVMKSLEKDRGRRYETANAFAADIERFLTDEPVLACPPSRLYRLGKFARRHKVALATASVIAVAVILGLVGTTWQSIVATRARDLAQRESRRANSAETEAKSEARRATNEATRADAKSRELEQQLHVSSAMRLAAESRAIRDRQPIRGMLLAAEAVESTRRHGELVVPVAHEALLNAVAQVGGRPLVGHQEGITSLAIRLDSRWLATASGDGTARLWDRTAEDPAASSIVLQFHKEGLASVAVSPNGQWLVTGGLDNAAVLWDLTVRDPTTLPIPLVGHTEAVLLVAISPDNRWVVTGSRDGTARLWDLTTPGQASPQFVLPHGGGVGSIAFSPDGRWLITSSVTNLAPPSGVLVNSGAVGTLLPKGAAQLWDLTAEDPATSSVMLRQDDSDVWSLVISADSRALFTGAEDGTIRRWDLSLDLPSPEVLGQHDDAVLSLAMTVDGQRLASGSRDTTARLWDLTAEDPSLSAVSLGGHAGWVKTVAVDANSRWLATGSQGAVRIWNVSDDNITMSPTMLPIPEGTVSSLAILPNGRLIAAVFDRSVHLWNVDAEDPASTSVVLRGHDRNVRSVAISPDRQWLATCSNDGTARMWDLSSDYPASPELVLRNAVGASPDGRWMVAMNASRTTLWDLTSEKPSSSAVSLPRQDDLARGGGMATVSHDGRWLAERGEDYETVRLWDLRSAESAASPSLLQGHDDRILSIAISPDGRWLVTASNDNTTLLWDLRSVDPSSSSLPLVGHTARVRSIAFSPDSRRLVTGSSDRTARLWDLISPNPVSSPIVLRGHTRVVRTVSISPDGRWVITGSADRTVRLWDLSTVDPASSPLVFSHESGAIWAAAISPNGRWLASSGGNDGNVRLWDLERDDPTTEPALLQGHEAVVTSLAIGPDSRWLVTGSLDETARLWDLTVDDVTSSSIVLPGHEPANIPISISPDGRWVITANNGERRLWDLDLESLIARARRLAGRELMAEEKKQYLVESP